MTTAPNRRPGFTLVEMMVASALIIFMMYIIASAFESGLTSFRVLKAQGDMQEKLRGVATAIRMDLTTPHFGGAMYPTNQGPYLQDHRLNDQTWQPPQMGYVRISMPPPPTAINANTTEGLDPDGSPAPAPLLRYVPLLDPTSMYLQFTVNLTDGHPASRDARGRRDQYYATNVTNTSDFTKTTMQGISGRPETGFSKPDYSNGDPSVSLSSYWAEVTYFLRSNGQTTNGAVPLYTLFRRQKLLVEPNAMAPLGVMPAFAPNTNDKSYPDVSSWYGGGPSPGYVFNTPSHVTEPVRRWGMGVANWTASNPPPAFGQPQGLPFKTILEEANGNYGDTMLGQRIGGDVLLTDVLSFEIKVLWEPVRTTSPNTDKFNTAVTADFQEPQPSRTVAGTAVGNPDYPFDWLPAGINRGMNPTIPNGIPDVTAPVPRVFDTWSSNNDLSGAKPYIFGVNPNDPAVDPTAKDSRDGQQLMFKASSPADPDYANWNAGHFKAAPTPTAAQPAILAPPPGLPTQPNTNIPLRIRVRALQIKLRLWDRKTSQTRQVTIIQDLVIRARLGRISSGRWAITA